MFCSFVVGTASPLLVASSFVSSEVGTGSSLFVVGSSSVLHSLSAIGSFVSSEVGTFGRFIKPSVSSFASLFVSSFASSLSMGASVVMVGSLSAIGSSVLVLSVVQCSEYSAVVWTSVSMVPYKTV
ncbi:MAG: hypothetical protein LBD75_05250, partial [Candidatus Peribacteria bacterium]|nr:hypothetical protein [Candidatus Peribacteria bacterium]